MHECRLSIDWGEGFAKPTLTSFEAMVALGAVPAWWEEAPPATIADTITGAAAAEGVHGNVQAEGYEAKASDAACCKHSDRAQEQAATSHYPMDYYSRQGGEWSSSYHKAQPRPSGQRPAAQRPVVAPT